MPNLTLKNIGFYLVVVLLFLVSILYYIKDSSISTILLVSFLSIAFIIYILYLYFRVDKSEKELVSDSKRAKEENFLPIKSDITFNDIAGMDELKNEFKDIIEYLKDPKKYIDFGIRMPKGVLLSGKAGVGKTLLAKAVAGEAGVDFFYQSGATFVQIYVGMGAKRVHELFDCARESKKAIIFIDEIDAIGRSRGGDSDERDATLNQLLIEMDGFDKDSSVVVIAATNNIDILDEALLRSGRFDRRVEIALPNSHERVEILKLHLKNKRYSLDLKELSNMTIGFTPATIATFVNEATINALNRGAKIIELEDFEVTLKKVSNILHKDIKLSDNEREYLSIYQAAKALVAYEHGIEFNKIDLLGDRFIEQESNYKSKTKVKSMIDIHLSGIIANKILLNQSYTNTKDDLIKAKKLANMMIYEYGMGDNIFGNDYDLSSLIDEIYSDLESYISENKRIILKLSKQMYENEYLNFEDIKRAKDEIL